MTVASTIPDGASSGSRLAAEGAAKERTPFFRAQMSEKAGGMYSRSEVSEILGISPAAIDDAVERRELLGVSYDDETCYPAAQFKNGGVVVGLAALLEAFGDMNPWGQLQLLVTPMDQASESSIFDLLAQGVDQPKHERLISLVRGWAA